LKVKKRIVIICTLNEQENIYQSQKSIANWKKTPNPPPPPTHTHTHTHTHAHAHKKKTCTSVQNKYKKSLRTISQATYFLSKNLQGSYNNFHSPKETQLQLATKVYKD